MDKARIEYLINIIVLVPVILILVVISLKLSKKGIEKINISSYAQVIERFNLTKDITLYVLKLGTTGCVLVSSQHNNQVIKELSEDEIDQIINMKKENSNSIDISKLYKFDIKSILNNKFTKEKDYGHIE